MIFYSEFCEEEKIVYTVSMQDDLIERVDFEGSNRGHLEFSYLQQINNAGLEFAAPRKSKSISAGTSQKGFFGLPKVIESIGTSNN